MTISGADISGLAADSQGLDKLKYQAKQSPEQALKSAAQQFEAVFLNMMLKSMREATPQDGMFDSEQTKMFTGMLDQQLAQTMAARGVGLADVMIKQLSRAQGLPDASPSGQAAAALPTPPSSTQTSTTSAVPSVFTQDAQQAFVNKMREPALQASKATGIPAHLIMGQAALESGWGKREIRMADGSNSHNLFGIKAGKDWTGKVAEVMTTEYHNGVASKQVEKFRAYDSYADSFKDYASLLSENPRYSSLIGQEDGKKFAVGLQKAGYATDPHYADKLAGVISSVRARA